MRGFLYGVLGLTALYLAVTAGPAQLATALSVPTKYLAEWADPTRPLITGTGSFSGTPAAAAPHPRSGPPRPGAGHMPPGAVNPPPG